MTDSRRRLLLVVHAVPTTKPSPPGPPWRSMVGTPENGDPRAFALAALADAVREMVAIPRRARPHVVITDNASGSYGHPDHVQAHRVAAALDPAADRGYAPELGEPRAVRKAYWSALPRSTVERLVADGVFDIADELPGGPDEEITAQIDGREYLSAKLAAPPAHRSQVDLRDGLFAQLASVPEFALEHYQLVRGERGSAGPGERYWENDLFAELTGQ